MARPNKRGEGPFVAYALVIGLGLGIFIYVYRFLAHPVGSHVSLEKKGQALALEIQSWAQQSGLSTPDALKQLGVGVGSCLQDEEDAIVLVPSYGQPDPELNGVLLQTADEKREVMIALANGVMICKNTTICWWNGGNILHTWLEMIARHGINNLVVGVLDDETWEYMDVHFPNVVKFRPKSHIPSSQLDTHPANRVSTLKYGLIKDILQMGYHALVTDMDLVFLDNPFNHLYRDSDIESQTDGFSNMAYGQFDSIHDKTMGWGAGGLFSKIFTLNVGCLYVRSTPKSIDLMNKVNHRLLHEKGWDQQVFNEEVFFLTHGDVRKAQVSVRVMDYLQFANSKTFFRSERHHFFPGHTATMQPLMVHMNYHPDKHDRMLCIMARYFQGQLDACDKLPGGSEKGT
eukprot:CAMPEP_0114251440 /NCGR_PEP_ID=MMETSP0058-20121206/15273_1 /TAXON_ID=36894 /ORGANISM="Pyramimonas parkeae, CCMP726" /LENGTH=401 /DNA_ID=CAMNT_0001365245 /DNA_START=31 /DNA_END=1236 /DNA_ORIENTATION=+